MGAVVGAMHASGHRRRPAPGAVRDRRAVATATREALAELFEPERERLRLSPEHSAEVFGNVLFSRARTTDGQPPSVSTADLVDLFLNGALST
jgi:hypothetical protein